jgi:hypothetical protein
MTKTDATAYELKRDEYIDLLKPIFLPADPVSNDVLRYFASLLRVLGMEDRGWDPYAESRATLNDINGLFSINLPEEHFSEPHRTHWRFGLILYSHVVEMDAPYEVIANLLRFQLGDGYSPNPFFKFLTKSEQENFRRRGITTGRKIEIIKQLSERAGYSVGNIFNEYYDNKLRNSIAHADFILTDDDFRSRGDISGTKAFRVSYEELDRKIMCAKAFISAFFSLERGARQLWGVKKQCAIPYDLHYKGLLEILVDEEDLLCGFRVHWPNKSRSTYRRTKDGVEMSNCSLDLEHATISLFVDRYAVSPGAFSPLVEKNTEPIYTTLEGCNEPPVWPKS